MAATDIYGEIEVLATQNGIYFSGANWDPGCPAGGYVGTQDISSTERRSIFSIWDTVPTVTPVTIAADAATIYGPFGGEGTGMHSHMVYPWTVGETFRYYLHKQPSTAITSATDTLYYFFDKQTSAWRHMTTITSPNAGIASVSTFGNCGTIASFLENFSGGSTTNTKLAIYRLWRGSSIDKLTFMRSSGGDGQWGQLGNGYYLAGGSQAGVDAVLQQAVTTHGKLVIGDNLPSLAPLPDVPLPQGVQQQLLNLPLPRPVVR